MKLPLPTPLCLIVCEAIHIEPETQKPVVLGLSPVVLLQDEPLERQHLCLYVELMSVRERCRVQVRMERVDGPAIPGRSLLQWTLDVRFPLPLRSSFGILRHPNVAELDSGLYRATLACDGETLMERPVQIERRGASE